MSRFVYVNGRYQRYGDAHIHVEDRGFQFADAVYEVIEIRDSALVDQDRHDQRLRWSLKQLGIAEPMGAAALSIVIAKVVRLNRVRNGIVYLQVSRGHARRDFVISNIDAAPSLVILARPLVPSRPSPLAEKSHAPSETQTQAVTPPNTPPSILPGIAVITRPDPRWARCDIKTVMLLPASLEKTEALHRHGAKEVWFVDEDETIIEGGSSTSWIVDASGTLRTRTLSQKLLPGVTRSTMVDVIADLGLPFAQQAFTIAEAKAASEAFNTAASSTITPVVQIDGHRIGTGTPGPVTLKLKAMFHEIAARTSRAPMFFAPVTGGKS
ncbi:MAG: aminotransferase class IV [Pseudomonadota bacterium]